MSTGTVNLHRVLRANPERIYRAFLDADAMAKWLPPYGFTCRVQHLDARVGGSFRLPAHPRRRQRNSLIHPAGRRRDGPTASWLPTTTTPDDPMGPAA